MYLPSGTKIKSNSDSENMVRNASGPMQAFGSAGETTKTGSVSITIQHMEVRSDTDIEKIAEELAKRIEEAEENM